MLSRRITARALALSCAMAGPGMGSSALLLVLLTSVTSGCTSVQKAAAQDPQRCERDPKCKGHQDKSADCVTQCVDDPACIDRCTQVTGQFH